MVLSGLRPLLGRRHEFVNKHPGGRMAILTGAGRMLGLQLDSRGRVGFAITLFKREEQHTGGIAEGCQHGPLDVNEAG